MRKQIVSFDLLRIYACLCVVAVHTSILFPIPGKIGEIMGNGSSGVSVFMALSGFLIFQSLEKKEKLSFWYAKRLARIVPIYYFVLIADLAIYGYFLQDKAEVYGYGCWIDFLFINKVVPADSSFWINVGAVWSISCFVIFYFMAPLLKKCINSFHKSLIFMIVMYAVAKLLPKITPWCSFAESIYIFAAGIFVYYAIKENKQRQALILGLSIIVLLILADSRGGILYTIAVALLMLASYDLTIKNETVCKVIAYVSSLTFCIYLAHGAVMQVIQTMQTGSFSKDVLIFVIGSVCGTFVLYYLVDRPVSGVLRRKLSKKEQK